jgi:predicted aspartyl protease
MVQVGISNVLMDIFTRDGIPIPPHISLNALIDTGATNSTISTGKIDSLGLNPIGAQSIIGVGHTKPTHYPMYRVGVSLFGVEYFDTTVTVLPINIPYNTECLIGRDILMRCLFTYNGPGGSFSLRGQQE